MCLGGGGINAIPVKQEVDFAKETDNPYVNPISGDETPWWKIPEESRTPEAKERLTARLNLTNR